MRCVAIGMSGKNEGSMEEKNNEMNQNNVDSHAVQTNDPYAVQQTSDPYAIQRTSDPYAVQRTSDPYAVQQTNSPYGGSNRYNSQPINPYGVQERSYVPKAQKRGNAAKIIAGVACVFTLIAALLVGGIVYVRNTPAYRISRGFRNLGKEISQSKNPLVEKAGISDLLQMIEEDGSHIDSSLNFSTQLPLFGSTTLGVDTDYYKDMHARELNADTTISLMNMEFAHVNIYADDEVFCFSIPELFLENMYIENENVVSQYNNSLLAELGSRSSMEEFSIDLFGDEDGRIQAQDWRDLESIWKKLEADLEACGEGMTVGKVEKGLYRVTFPGKEVDRLLRNLLDSSWKMSGSNAESDAFWKDYKKILSSDISLLLEINGSRIDSIMLEEPVRLWDDTASFAGEIFFLGEKRSIDKIQGKAEIDGVDGRKRKLIGQFQQTTGEENHHIDMDLKYSEEEEEGKIKFVMNCDAVKDTFDMTLSMKDSKDDLEVELEGSLDDITRGESLKLDLDQVSFQTEGEELYRITGEVDIEPLQGAIRPSVDPDTAFFEMSLPDWEKIITKLDDAYGSILNSLW